MEGRNERRALSAEREIAAAEIGDGVDAGQGGDAVGIAELKRQTSRAVVEDRLAVAADHAHALRRYAGRVQQGLRRARELLADRRIERGEFAQAQQRLLEAELEQSRAQGRRVVEMRAAMQCDEAAIDELGERGVDAVRAGSRHQADREHGPSPRGGFSACCWPRGAS